MSRFRNQLRAMSHRHRSARYPGDLGCEVIPASNSAWRRRLLAATAALTAAAIVLLVDTFLHTTVTPPQTSFDTPAIARDTSLPALPSFPEGFSIVPHYEPLIIPAMPAFPSLETEQAVDSPTTQETVL